MRIRIAAVLVVAVIAWIGWGVFIYRPAPNALPACVPNAARACSTVDGFPIGPMLENCPCSDRADSEQVAVDGLDARDGGHPAIVGTTIFAVDMARLCGPVLCGLSGTFNIFVFDLQDGSDHAIGVRCGVGGCRAVLTYTAGSAG